MGFVEKEKEYVKQVKFEENVIFKIVLNWLWKWFGIVW